MGGDGGDAKGEFGSLLGAAGRLGDWGGEGQVRARRRLRRALREASVRALEARKAICAEDGREALEQAVSFGQSVTREGDRRDGEVLGRVLRLVEECAKECGKGLTRARRREQSIHDGACADRRDAELASQWAIFCARLEADSQGLAISRDMLPGSDAFLWAQQLGDSTIRERGLPSGALVTRAIYLRPKNGCAVEPRRRRGSQGPSSTRGSLPKGGDGDSRRKFSTAKEFSSLPVELSASCCRQAVGEMLKNSLDSVVGELRVEHSSSRRRDNKERPALAEYLSCECLEWLLQLAPMSMRVYYCLEDWISRGKRTSDSIDEKQEQLDAILETLGVTRAFSEADKLGAVYCSGRSERGIEPTSVREGGDTLEKYLKTHRSMDKGLRRVPDIILGGGQGTETVGGLHYAPATGAHLLLASLDILESVMQDPSEKLGMVLQQLKREISSDIPLKLYITLQSTATLHTEPLLLLLLDQKCLRHLLATTAMLISGEGGLFHGPQVSSPSAVDSLPRTGSCEEDQEKGRHGENRGPWIALVRDPPLPEEMPPSENLGSCAVLLHIQKADKQHSGRALSSSPPIFMNGCDSARGLNKTNSSSRRIRELSGGLCQWRGCAEEEASSSLKLCQVHAELKKFVEKRGAKGAGGKLHQLHFYISPSSRQKQSSGLPQKQAAVASDERSSSGSGSASMLEDLKGIKSLSSLLLELLEGKVTDHVFKQGGLRDRGKGSRSLRSKGCDHASLPLWILWRNESHFIREISKVSRELTASEIVLELERKATRELQYLAQAGVYPAEELKMMRREHSYLESEWTKLQECKLKEASPTESEDFYAEAVQKESELEIEYCRRKLALLSARRQSEGQNLGGPLLQKPHAQELGAERRPSSSSSTNSSRAVSDKKKSAASKTSGAANYRLRRQAAASDRLSRIYS